MVLFFAFKWNFLRWRGWNPCGSTVLVCAFPAPGICHGIGHFCLWKPLHAVVLMTLVVFCVCRMLNGILVYWTAFFFYKILICFLWLVVCVLSLVTAHCRHGWLGRQYHLRLPVSKMRGSTWTYQKERKNLLPYPRFTVSILNTCAFLYCHPDSQPCMGTRLLGCHLRTLSQANSWRINPSQIFNLLDSYLLQSGYHAN
jgi:hypothetical protein